MSKESQADPCCKEESKNEVHQVERLISSLQISEDSSKHQSKSKQCKRSRQEFEESHQEMQQERRPVRRGPMTRRRRIILENAEIAAKYQETIREQEEQKTIEENKEEESKE